MLVICLHNVVAGAPGCSWEISQQQLERLLQQCVSNGYQFISIADLARASERSVLLTIDDGRRGGVSWALNRAPEFGIATTVFVVPEWIDYPESIPEGERYGGISDWFELAKLREAGHTIGSHSLTHRPLPTLDADAITHELAHSKHRIQGALGINATHFSAPYGKYNELVLKAVKETGYQTLATTEPGRNSPAEIRSGVIKRFVLRSDLPDLGFAFR